MQQNENNELYIIRHGETQWTISGQHTGLTDIPLTEKGFFQAKQLSERLKKYHFEHIFSSPLHRALDTCRSCGYNEVSIIDELLEWNYGEYEGKKTAEIQQENPGWNLFTHGAPGGESIEDVKKRADRLLEKTTSLKGPVLLFTSGHISRAIAARWIGQPILMGKFFLLSPASFSQLGYERDSRVINFWNDVSHLG